MFLVVTQGESRASLFIMSSQSALTEHEEKPIGHKGHPKGDPSFF